MIKALLGIIGYLILLALCPVVAILALMAGGWFFMNICVPILGFILGILGLK